MAYAKPPQYLYIIVPPVRRAQPASPDQRQKTYCLVVANCEDRQSNPPSSVLQTADLEPSLLPPPRPSRSAPSPAPRPSHNQMTNWRIANWRLASRRFPDCPCLFVHSLRTERRAREQFTFNRGITFLQLSQVIGQNNVWLNRFIFVIPPRFWLTPPTFPPSSQPSWRGGGLHQHIPILCTIFALTAQSRLLSAQFF